MVVGYPAMNHLFRERFHQCGVILAHQCSALVHGVPSNCEGEDRRVPARRCYAGDLADSFDQFLPALARHMYRISMIAGCSAWMMASFPPSPISGISSMGSRFSVASAMVSPGWPSPWASATPSVSAADISPTYCLPALTLASIREFLRQHARLEYNFIRDGSDQRYVELEVLVLQCFEFVWDLDVLLLFDLLVIHQKAYRNRVPKFRRELAHLHREALRKM